MNSTGMNTAASDNVIDMIVKPISLDPSSAACSALSHLHVPHDVFQHHDRVVHDESDRQRQRHQRKIVERCNPSMYITANVPTIDIGSARLGMIVAEMFRRKKKDHHHHQTMVSISVN